MLNKIIHQRSINNFHSRQIVGLPNDCWHWNGQHAKYGYGITSYRIIGSAKTTPSSAHRLSWMIANDQMIPIGMVIMHTCDNPGCCNPAHLKLGTYSDNSVDMVRKGRACPPKGEKHKDASLTDDQVREIRRVGIVDTRGGHLSTKISNTRQLATLYGVSIGCIRNVLRGKYYKSVS